MINVALTPASIQPAPVAVVIDVLRASSTITEALAAGYRRIRCCRTIEQAEALREPGRVIAGERACIKPPGFELGNSPAAFRRLRGQEVVLTTTNGCPAMFAAAAVCDRVLVGSLLNLEAILAELDGAGDVVLVCAGTDGAPAIEDTYLAGRISATLGGARSDSARIAEAVAAAHPRPSTALRAGRGAAALLAAGLAADIDWCAQESVLDVVPQLSALEDDVALVDAAAPISPQRDQLDPILLPEALLQGQAIHR